MWCALYAFYPSQREPATFPVLGSQWLCHMGQHSSRCLMVSYKNRLAIRKRDDIKEEEKASRTKEKGDDVQEQTW